MLVKLKHGVCSYQGTRFNAGDEFNVSELFYKTNSTRFEPVVEQVNIQNVIPTEEKPKQKRTRKRKGTS